MKKYFLGFLMLSSSIVFGQGVNERVAGYVNNVLMFSRTNTQVFSEYFSLDSTGKIVKKDKADLPEYLSYNFDDVKKESYVVIKRKGEKENERESMQARSCSDIQSQLCFSYIDKQNNKFRFLSYDPMEEAQNSVNVIHCDYGFSGFKDLSISKCVKYNRSNCEKLGATARANASMFTACTGNISNSQCLKDNEKVIEKLYAENVSIFRLDDDKPMQTQVKSSIRQFRLGDRTANFDNNTGAVTVNDKVQEMGRIHHECIGMTKKGLFVTDNNRQPKKDAKGYSGEK